MGRVRMGILWQQCLMVARDHGFTATQSFASLAVALSAHACFLRSDPSIVHET